MKAVLITYTGSSRTRIVPQAHIRTTLTSIKYAIQERAIVEALGTMHRSPMTDGPKIHWYGRGSSDIRCWKRCNKHAQKNWQRHSNRTHSKPKGRFRYRHRYQPSARLLYQQDLFNKMGLSV